MKNDTAKNLGIDGTEVNLNLITMHGTDMISMQKITGLAIENLERNTQIRLPNAVYCRNNIPSGRDEIPRPGVAKGWQHLAKLAEEIPQYQENAEIGLLIGSNCPKAIEPQEVIPGNERDPYAIRTLLGWGIIGPVSKLDKDDVEIYETSCNHVVATEIASEKKPNIVFVPESRVKEIIGPLLINKMFELDFQENSNMSPTYSSTDDETFLRKVSDGVRLRTDGHYEIPLPFNDDEIKLPKTKD